MLELSTCRYRYKGYDSRYKIGIGNKKYFVAYLENWLLCIVI